MFRPFASFVCAAAFVCAQDPTPPAPEAQSPALPAANTDRAMALVDTALDKLIAYGRGRFSSTEASDDAMLRNAGIPFGPDDTSIEGGWHRSLVWADADGRDYVRAGGRMLAKVEGGWRLRRSKLAGGVEAPFTLDPNFFITVFKRLPKSARVVAHVEAGKLKGKQCTILTCKLAGDDALEFADSGAIPSGSGGLGGMIVMGGLGGMGLEPPRPELDIYVAFFIDQQSGDLVRLASKTYQRDEMMGNVAIQIGFGGGDLEEEEEEEEEEADDDADGPIEWRRGFPRVKPKKDQSVLTYRVDFKDLGLADPPALSDELKALLRVR